MDRDPPERGDVGFVAAQVYRVAFNDCADVQDTMTVAGAPTNVVSIMSARRRANPSAADIGVQDITSDLRDLMQERAKDISTD